MVYLIRAHRAKGLDEHFPNPPPRTEKAKHLAVARGQELYSWHLSPHPSPLSAASGVAGFPAASASWQSVRQLHCTRRTCGLWRASLHQLHRSKQCPPASGPRGVSQASLCSRRSPHHQESHTLLSRGGVQGLARSRGYDLQYCFKTTLLEKCCKMKKS